ncbi:Hypothetical predicted protein [Mytilus galloprovincialis]|uniref:G-protein coupled receptors family 1 profile domain-containing protein n=1 Tax=Mytilus galloprovincialis TaxID=29158 RepID=A0A8B6G469_MYTGA|nr:Hypothetical predicted protein [Mytilus galloprovincialis]
MTITKIILLVAVLVSNTIVAITWLSPTNRTAITVLLSMIAFYDTFTMLFSSLWSIVGYFFVVLSYSNDCYLAFVTFNFARVFHVLSSYTTTFLAVQRCVICVFPFAGPRYCRMKSTLLCGLVSIIAVVLVICPCIFISGLGELKVLTNQTSYLCDTDFILSDDAFLEYLNVDNILRFLTIFAPQAIVLICMILCAVTVNRKKIGAGRSSEQKNKVRTTTMLILIMLSYVLRELPSSILFFFISFYPKVQKWLKTGDGIKFCNMSLTLSYLLNIWVYIIMSKQFRESLRGMFCREKKQPKKAHVDRFKTPPAAMEKLDSQKTADKDDKDHNHK